MKTPRTYNVTDHLLEAYERLPISRSSAMTMAVSEAFKNPQLLERALGRRIKSPESDLLTARKTTRVSVTFSPETVDQLNHLALVTQLPIEHALRLAMEAYIHKL